jgi:hypothetical protein
MRYTASVLKYISMTNQFHDSGYEYVNIFMKWISELSESSGGQQKLMVSNPDLQWIQILFLKRELSLKNKE